MPAGGCQLKYLCTQCAPAEGQREAGWAPPPPVAGHKQRGAKAGVPAAGRTTKGRGGSNAAEHRG